MRWTGRRQSANVEDRRGFPAGRVAAGGGIGTVVLLLLYLVLGGDPGAIQQPPGGAVAPRAIDQQAENELKEFVAVVLADTEDVWHALFRTELTRQYREPALVLFTGQVDSACGFASAAVGPFYCPRDSKLYIDLSFFDELKRRFQAPGDFAVAYVIAHEVGHHIQNELGVLDKVHRLQQQVDKVEANRLSVRLELHADYLSGVWAHHAQRMKQILEEGDIEEALRAASAVGDDKLQQQARGHVVPDSFTHGTAAQRARWFRRGFESGNLKGMDLLFEQDYSEL